MPTIGPATDHLYLGDQRVREVYAGDALAWPQKEEWSSWQLVGTVGGGLGTAWFDTGRVQNYGNGHEQVRWRYSNMGRLQYRGIMTAKVTFGADIALIGAHIDPAELPKPTANQMSWGLCAASTGTQSSTFTGGPVRWQITPHDGTYHHYVKAYRPNSAETFPAGGWLSIYAEYNLLAAKP